jgi:hypothetical protein
MLLAATCGRQIHDFTDEELAVLLREQRCGLIAVVSPQMPLSITNLRNVTQVAEANGLALTVLLDPNAGEAGTIDELSGVISADTQVSRNASRTLGLHGSLLHYPTVHAYIDGALDPRVIYGAKSIESYEALILQVVNSAPASSNDAADVGCAGVDRLRRRTRSQLETVDRAPSADTGSSFDPATLPVSQRWQQSGQFRLDRVPKYYFKPLATGSWVAYQAGLSNYLIDLASGREIEVPGVIDPVPSPDEKVLVVPSTLAVTGLGRLHFFRVDELMAGGSARAALVFSDGEIPGTYQSVGQRMEGGRAVYRVVSESLFLRKGLYFQDYESVVAGGRAVELRPKITSTRRLCPELSFALPAISKNGKLLSGVDPISRSTQVLTIDDAGACELHARLGHPTSKADFAFDDRRLAFHMSAIDSRSVTEVMKRPGRELRLDVYVYDLTTRELERVTNCGDANCYYPAFRANGELVYLRQETRDHSYSFVTLKPRVPATQAASASRH